jgi:hypothetical protein
MSINRVRTSPRDQRTGRSIALKERARRVVIGTEGGDMLLSLELG